ncbi:hypothetical protein AWB64_05758 [Caballeronia sordidicola]|uniref:Uncharacterized protein n=1 Tax=Caballeronia sordidicola TaxID=196367 RepID=A0A158I9V1_CABSO|nr:VF_A0006 family four-cysteine protein [Caballeronia sordidicola]SAL53029.1 hypothetical protein AWB64_05758 [Caballeronia sordidicola]
MKQGIGLLVALSLTLLTSGAAMAFDEDASYNQCVLQSLKGVRSNYATDLITASCRKLYKESAFLNNNEKNYRVCLLQNLQGAENDYASQQIMAACGRQNGR